MTEMDKWLNNYSHPRQNIRYPLIYRASVLIFLISFVGILWTIEKPQEFEVISPILNWGLLFLMAAIIYYFIISITLGLGMIPFIMMVIGFFLWLENTDYSIITTSIGFNIISLFGLYQGRQRINNIESLLDDIQMIIIGPICMLSELIKILEAKKQ
tara:strand:- start:879 stop:1349 length:471 start_codon:yes stop_codon:yes gene_type:complete